MSRMAPVHADVSRTRRTSVVALTTRHRHKDIWKQAFLALLICARIFYWRHSHPLVSYTRVGSATIDSTNQDNYGTSKDVLLCIGWRRTRDCPVSHYQFLGGIDIMMPFFRDLSCDQPIPKDSAGSCELQTQDGTIIHAMNKTCAHRHHPKAKFLTCNMAINFVNYKQEAHTFQEEPFLDAITNGNSGSRGIVMSVYNGVLVSAYAVIRVLRDHNNCTLPIELWSKPNEIDNDSVLVRDLLKDPNITQRFIEDDSVSGYMSKPYCLFHSAFDEVLLLDADTLPLKDPSYLFDMEDYQQTGAMFFPDYWSPRNTVFSMTSDSLLWELLGIPFVDEFEMESGQLLVDKTKTRPALNMLMFLARTYDRWIGPLWLAWGDKDLFRFAWKMTNTTFHYIQQPPSTVGFSTETVDVCGVTLLQHDPDGDAIFLHRNTVKLKDRASLEKVWWKKQIFVGDDALEQYRIQPSPVKGRKIKCYHPTPVSSKWFQTKNLTGTNIEALEDALLKWGQQALRVAQN